MLFCKEFLLLRLLVTFGVRIEIICLNAKDKVQLILGLNPSKAMGPGELHPRILKELTAELGPVFAHLFQQSLDPGEILEEWSLANICPLSKKGDRALASSYRPVSYVFSASYLST